MQTPERWFCSCTLCRLLRGEQVTFPLPLATADGPKSTMTGLLHTRVLVACWCVGAARHWAAPLCVPHAPAGAAAGAGSSAQGMHLPCFCMALEQLQQAHMQGPLCLRCDAACSLVLRWACGVCLCWFVHSGCLGACGFEHLVGHAGVSGVSCAQTALPHCGVNGVAYAG
jgi:hypothetical protein